MRSTQAQKVGAHKILNGKAAERPRLTSHFRLRSWQIFPGKRRLIRGHEFIGARHPRQGEPLAARTTKVVAHMAMAVHEPVHVPKINPGHSPRKSSQLDPCDCGFSLGSASNAISKSRTSHTFRPSIRFGPGIRPSRTSSSNLLAEMPITSRLRHATGRGAAQAGGRKGRSSEPCYSTRRSFRLRQVRDLVSRVTPSSLNSWPKALLVTGIN